MAENTGSIKRLQLDDSLRGFSSASPPTPRGGWVRAVRDALGITKAQLATRLGVARQSLDDLERAEAKRRITLESLDRLAEAMDCRLVYAIVPKAGSLEDVRTRRAQELADVMLKTAEHSMELEAQGVPVREGKRQRKLLVDSLLRGSSRKLWR